MSDLKQTDVTPYTKRIPNTFKAYERSSHNPKQVYFGKILSLYGCDFSKDYNS